MSAIEASWQHYSSGGTDYLYHVNDKDTTMWDPCKNAGKMSDEYVRGAIALIFTVGIRIVQFVFIPETAELVNMAGEIALTVAPLATGWYWSGALMTDGEDKVHNANMAAASLLYGGGILGAGVVGKLLDMDNVLVTTALGAAAGYALDSAFGSYVATVLSSSGFLTKYVLKLISWIVGMGQKVKCVFNFNEALICLAPEENAGDLLHMQSNTRRWDVPSVAAMLTDEALIKLGHPGERSSWQAEFIYRGLIMSPITVLMGIDPFYAKGKLASNDNNPYTNMLINPIGEIAPIGYSAKSSLNSESGQSFQPDALLSWGNESAFTTGWFSWGESDAVKGCNQTSCQNWDVMRNNKYGNATGSTQIAEAGAQIKTNLDNAVDTLVKNCTHENYLAIKKIQGITKPLLPGTFEPIQIPGTLKGFQPPNTFKPLGPPGAWRQLTRQFVNDPWAQYLKEVFNTPSVVGDTPAAAQNYFTTVSNYLNATMLSVLCAKYKLDAANCKVSDTARDWVTALTDSFYTSKSPLAAIDDLKLTHLSDEQQSRHVQAWVHPFNPDIPAIATWRAAFLAYETDPKRVARQQYLLGLAANLIDNA